MPGRGLRPCAGSPTCPELVSGRYCPQHAREREEARGSSHTRGYDATWHVTRARYLRDHAPKNAAGDPVCEECGRSAADSGAPLHVDHIDGLGPHGPRGHDVDNLQALCDADHGTKTAAQTKGRP